jgi:3-hydroxyisobutyrate dehydrogenase
MAQLAFLGIGNMGRPMADNLAKAGLSVTVFDVSEKARDAAKSAGMKVASTVAEAVKNADFVFSMLPASKHVEDLYLGSGALLKSVPAKAVLVDCSTIAPASARKVGLAAKAAGFEMIDAPVSGGTAGATAGTLTFMVGGEASTLEKVRGFLEKMGKKIFHAGDSGSGQVAKICNNMLLAIHMIGSCEALQLGRACGMDPKVLSEILMQSSGRNWSLEVYNPWPGVQPNVPASRDYQGGFAVDLMYKDLGLAIETAIEKQKSTPMGELARSLYGVQRDAGRGGLDFSSILKLFGEIS